MELRNTNINRCISANESHRNKPLSRTIAATLKKHLRSLFAIIDICANNCELMTFDPSAVKSKQTHRHRNDGTCTKLTLCEYAVHGKMVANSDRCGENSYVYFVNQNCGEQSASHCNRRPTNRANGCGGGGGGSSKSRIKQFFRGHSASVLILIIFSLGFLDMVNAGTCWMKRTQGGKCKQPMATNVTRADCCAMGDDVGFSEKEMNQYEYFFATAIGDGTSCSSCTDSCSTAKCAPQKRCVMRGGEPKCVCSPKCKSNPHHTKHHPSDDKTKASSPNDAQKTRRNINGNAHERDQRYRRRHAAPSADVQIAVLDRRGAETRSNSFNKNASMPKRDKVISIVSPSSQNSHRFRKNSPSIKSSSPSPPPSPPPSPHNETQRHGRKHRYNQHVGEQPPSHRHNDQNASWEDRIRSGFYGHDIPYPPIDVPLQIYDSDHQYHRAVCGSDGKTYRSECQLRKRACRQESTSLAVAYKGQCQTSCKHVQCPSGQHCLEDQNLMPHCVVCSMNCPPYDPAVKSNIANPSRLVCGTDGITYRNLCEIKRSACMLGRSIPVAYRGPCKEAANCNNIKCKDRQVCLNDLITHRPRCVSCSFKCPRRKRPQGQQSSHIKICGTNSKSYHSWCQMMKDSCNTGYFIDVKHNGVCHKGNTTVIKKQST